MLSVSLVDESTQIPNCPKLTYYIIGINISLTTQKMTARRSGEHAVKFVHFPRLRREMSATGTTATVFVFVFCFAQKEC